MIKPVFRGHRPIAWRAVMALSGCVVAVCIGCGTRPTPAPTFGGLVDTASRTVVLAYAESLQFDTVTGASDMQRVTLSAANASLLVQAGEGREDLAAVDRLRQQSLTQDPAHATRPQREAPVSGNQQLGPRVRIDPEIGAFKVGRSGIKGGRIIARLVNLDSATTPYPKLNLHARGTTYWWVDSAGPGYRSLFISSDTSDVIVPDTLIMHLSPTKWRQGLARLLWVPNDEELWTACDPWYCCKTTPL